MILFDAAKATLGEARVHTARQLVSFEQRPADGKVDVVFDVVDAQMRPTGERVTETCDVLIAADGIKSAVRQQLYPEDTIKYAGLMLWRATTTTDQPFLDGDTMFMAGTNDAKLVAYPIDGEARADGKSVINWIAECYQRDYDPETFGYSTPATKEDFRHLYDDWGGGFWEKDAAEKGEGLDIQKLIDGAEEVFAYPMCDRDPVKRWSFGRVTLLGDAAHAMRPNGSNGATQAILDGVCLARLLDPAALAVDAAEGDKHGDVVEAALEASEKERLEPTTRVVMANRGTGPEKVLQMVVDDPETPYEALDEVIAGYRKLAMFDIPRVNARFDAWQAEQAEAGGAAGGAL